MDKISHTKKYATTDLDYILFKEKSQFAAILESEQVTETLPQKRTMETSRPSGQPAKLSASDIKGKDDFIKIFELPEDERNRLISNLDPFTFDKYVKWEAANETELEIKRDGRIIKLK
jgi:hypothetical protein